jgi:hypothetical protein
LDLESKADRDVGLTCGGKSRTWRWGAEDPDSPDSRFSGLHFYLLHGDWGNDRLHFTRLEDLHLRLGDHVGVAKIGQLCRRKSGWENLHVNVLVGLWMSRNVR